MGYDIYLNEGHTPMGWRGQYVLPQNILLVDNTNEIHIKEVKRLNNIRYIETTEDMELNVFKANLKYTQRLKGNKRVRLLFRREVGIGDVLLSTIALESLHKAYRDDIIIDYWAPFPPARELLYYNPCIRQVYDNTVRSYKDVIDAFDIFIDLHKRVGYESPIDYYEPEVYEQLHWPHVGKSRGEIWCEYFGIQPAITVPKVYLSETEIQLARAIIHNKQIKPNRPNIAISTEATSPDKCMTERAIWNVASIVEKAGFNVFLVGTHPKDIPGKFANINKMTTRTVCAMYYWFDVALTFESMLGHMAAAAGTPQFCVYGRFDARESMGKYPKIKFYGIHGRLGDRCALKGPCWHRRPRCPYPCVTEINPREVAEGLIKHYEETKHGDRPYKFH